MFKQVLAASLLAATTAVQAGESLELGYRYDDVAGGLDNNNITLGYKNDVGSGLAAVAALTTTQRDDDRVQNRLRVGMTYSPSWWYLQPSLGYRWSQAVNNSFYQIEAGVTVPVTDGVRFRAGYRYRDAWDSTDDLQQGWVTAVAYRINKTYTLVGKYDLLKNSAGTDTQRFGIAVAKSF